MRITCPSCHAEASLEVLVGREADARAVSAFLARHVQLGDVLLRYVALHRPPKRRLGLARMVALLEELMVDVERGAVARKGRDWPTTPEMWRAALEQVLANHAKGTLSLPLSGHGYLHEVLQGLSDKAEGAAERAAEADRALRRRAAAADVTPQTVSSVLPARGVEPPSQKARDALASVRQRLAERALVAPAAASSQPADDE